MSPAFADLRTAQILAEIHFGRRAADAIGVLFRGRQQVFAAIMGRYPNLDSSCYARSFTTFPSADVTNSAHVDISSRRLSSRSPRR